MEQISQLVAFLVRQLGEQLDALLPELVRRALTRQLDDFFASAEPAIEEPFGRFHPKLRARARRLADAIPAMFDRLGERLAAHP
jgi:hypothetical protein